MTAAVDRKDSFRTPKLWWITALLAIAIALYGWRYAVLGERAYVPNLADSFKARPWGIFTHTVFGPFALLTGIFQFLPAMRKPGRWRMHRITGRVYVVSAIVLATAGLYMSFYSLGGVVTHVGFGFLALFTLATTVQGYLLIRRRKITAHRQWMLRSYSLIFGAVTLRIWLPLLIAAFHGEFTPAYQIVSWVSWVPNLLIAELMIRRGWAPSFKLGGDSNPVIIS
ncbi:MAG: DUF2306 domain-containing protein [Gemmatimonadales bacterium]